MQQRVRRAQELARQRISSLDDYALMRRWHQIISRVRNELTVLSIERQTMDLVVEVVNGNERFLRHPGRRFLDMARNWYAISMAASVRRQTDNDGRSASLRVILEEIRVRPNAYSMQTLRQFLPAPTEGDIRQHVMAEVCRGDQIDIEVVERDIDLLIGVSNNVTNYVNQHVAHTTHEPDGTPIEGPTLREIYDALVAFETIYHRWDRAITGNQTRGFPTEDGSGWFDVFDFPWRYRRPEEGEMVRRFLVTVNQMLDDEQMDALFEGDHERMAANEVDSMRRAIERSQVMDIGERLSEQMLPADVSVERLL